MGNLFSRNKSPATELERVALTIEDLKKRLQTISSSNSNTLYYYYMSIIVALSIAMAHTWLRFEEPTKSYVACALIFGAAVIVLAGRYIINGFFSWRTNRTTQKLENAISQKTTLLDLVKETLKFKEAKEILDRYEKTEQENNTNEKTALITHPPSPQKKPSADVSALGTPKNEQKKVETPVAQQPRPGTAMNQMGMTPYHQRNPNAVPVRPFLRQTTALDKLLDYFMSDGPNCRNALICSICHTHNGMSVPAEYPYISFRCFECGHFNPAKKMGPQFPLTRPPIGPKGIQHNGRAGPSAPAPQGSDSETNESQKPSTTLTPTASQHGSEKGSDSEVEKKTDAKEVAEQT
uniref:Endoplasmic reticulum junction formation protein lunapark n=1 Tax=Caenorhabditis tropicalis TaxID=1561998 RepID=A0A1I7TII2_9PELO